MGKRIQSTSKLSSFIKKNYGTAVNFGREINKYFKTEVFLESSHQCKPICNWARGDNKPRQSKWKWDLLVKYCKKVHNVDVDFTWLEQDIIPETSQPKEQDLFDYDGAERIVDDVNKVSSSLDEYSTRITKAQAADFARRAAVIWEMSKHNNSFHIDITGFDNGEFTMECRVFQENIGDYGLETIKIKREQDLVKLSDFISSLPPVEESEEDFVKRIKSSLSGKDFERFTEIAKAEKGGGDE